MTRETFHQELDYLKAAVVGTTTLVESALAYAAQALLMRDVALAEQVIEGDTAVDKQQERHRARTFEVIVCQAPVARDLRRVLTFHLVINELERIGDLAVEIAHQAIQLASQPPAQRVEALPKMARLVRQQLHDASCAFVEENLASAREICTRDDAVDLLYRQIFEEVLFLMQKAGNAPQAASLLFVAHDLKRVGDRITTICEDLIYLVTGEREDLNQGSGQIVLSRP